MIVADCSNEPLTGVLWPWPPYTLDLVRSSDTERASSQYSFQIHFDKFKYTQCEEKIDWVWTPVQETHNLMSKYVVFLRYAPLKFKFLIVGLMTLLQKI